MRPQIADSGGKLTCLFAQEAAKHGKIHEMKTKLAFGVLLLGATACAGFSLDVGHWNVSFNEEGEALRLENGTCKISVEGRFSFSSEGKAWRVATAR